MDLEEIIKASCPIGGLIIHRPIRLVPDIQTDLATVACGQYSAAGTDQFIF